MKLATNFNISTMNKTDADITADFSGKLAVFRNKIKTIK